MQQDRSNSRTNSHNNKSIAANNNNAGVSMPAVSPLIALSPQKEVAQLVKLTSKTLGQTIETTTETDVELLLKFQALRWKNPNHAEAIDNRLKQLSLVSKTLGKTIYPSIETDVDLLLQFKDRFKSNPKALAKIDKRLLELDPLPGFKQSIPGQDPGTISTTKETTPLLTTGKTSKAQGQEFKKRSLSHKFTPLTKPTGNESEVPRVKADKLELWNGKPLRLRWFEELRGETLVKAPYILCVYTLEWIRAEEADMDHVIPTATLKKHLGDIAKKMNDVTTGPGYVKGVEFSLKQKGLDFDHWFIKNSSDNWVPTQWAMFELHNNPNNLVFSSKYYNQIGKNAKDTMTLIMENPWYGAYFFNNLKFNVAASSGIGTTTGKGIAPEMESHLLSNHSETIERLAEEKEGERMMSRSIKLDGLGKTDTKGQKALRRKRLLRKNTLNIKDKDVSSSSDSDSDDTSLRKGVGNLIGLTGLQDEFIPKETVEEDYLPWETVTQDYISREKVERKFLPTKKVNEDFVPKERFSRSEKRKDKYKRRSRQFEKERDEHKGERDTLESELQRLREELNKREKELERKDEELKKKDVELSRKRRHSDEKPQSVKKTKLSGKLTERYRKLDMLLHEDDDTNRLRITEMTRKKVYNSPGAFTSAFESQLQQKYGIEEWRDWKYNHLVDWRKAVDCLAEIFDQRR